MTPPPAGASEPAPPLEASATEPTPPVDELSLTPPPVDTAHAADDVSLTPPPVAAGSIPPPEESAVQVSAPEGRRKRSRRPVAEGAPRRVRKVKTTPPPPVVAAAPPSDASDIVAANAETPAPSTASERPSIEGGGWSDPPASSAAKDAKAEAVEKTEKIEPVAAEKADALEAKDEEKSDDAKDDPDHVSVPPASDLDEHEHFFKQGETEAIHARESGATRSGAHAAVVEAEPRDSRLAMKATPAAQRRRAQLAKYVKAAVGVAAAVCLAALVKAAIARNHSADADRRPIAAAAQLSPTAAPQPAGTVEATEPKKDETAATEPKTDEATEPKKDETAATEPKKDEATEPKKDETAATEPKKDEAPTPIGEEALKQAKKDKVAARNALEFGSAKKAIEAGEKSIQLDPTDAETWLILGAAYQQAGNWKEANRCFVSCMKEGKRGPKGECAAMLRGQ